MVKPAKLFAYRDLARLVDQAATAAPGESRDGDAVPSTENGRRLERVKTVAAYLGDTAVVDGIDLLPDLQARLANLTPTAAEPRRRWTSPRLLGLAAAATVIALGLPIVLWKTWPTTTGPDAGYRAKTATTQRDARSRWIALGAFCLSGEAAPEPLHDVLHVDDGLLFTYTNLGPAPFSSLMIFGLDDSGRVYWYYPAFLDARDNPKSIDIQKDASRVGLHEVIAHPYREGSLTLFGLFSDEALSVAEVENAVQRGLHDGAALEAAFDGVRVKTLRVKVVP
jgi:hypothetical protein